MAEPIDPLAVLLRSVRIVGAECCWPASEILDVLRAFEDLERVVLGGELWRFDDGEDPTVLGWTEYHVESNEWHDRVVEAARKATDELLGHAGDQTAWVNLTWEARASRGS